MTDTPSSTQTLFPISPQFLPDRELEEGRYLLRFARSWEDLDAILRRRGEVVNLELEEGLDESGWPHWKLVKELPRFDLLEQEKLLKIHLLEYFDKL